MPRYRYVVNRNAQENGDHEVHREGCSHYPAPENQVPLGDFTTCHPAVAKAKEIYRSADGCAYCSKECHSR